MLVERLADPGHVAVPEDAEAARDQALLDTVALRVLVGQEADESLRRGQPERLQGTLTLRETIAAAASTAAATSPSSG